MPDRFNARAYWEALSPWQQRAIGEAALLLALFEVWPADDPTMMAGLERCEHAMEEGYRVLREAFPDASRWPAGPDLAALGIRACRQCGCTDASACADGCSWVADDLCSGCAVPAENPD
jgi:hypothetical protein